MASANPPPLVAVLQAYLHNEGLSLMLHDEPIGTDVAISDTGALPGLVLGAQRRIKDAGLEIDLGIDLVSDESSLWSVRTEVAPAADFEQFYFRWSCIAEYLDWLPRMNNEIALDHAESLAIEFAEQHAAVEMVWSPA